MDKKRFGLLNRDLMNKEDEMDSSDFVFETDEYAEDHNNRDDDDDDDEENEGRRTNQEEADSGLMYSWPKTYRKSMDMFANVSSSNICYVEGTVEGTSLDPSSASSSFYSQHHISEFDQTLTRPLISTTLNKDNEVNHLTKCSSQKFIHEPSLGNQCSFTQSLINGFNVLCGVGLLSTPFAVKQGGWSGLLLLFIFGAISCYTGLLLKRCLDSSAELQSYPDIGQSAFGSAGRLTVAIILYLELYVASVEYLILMSDNLSSLFPNTQLDWYGVHLDTHHFFAILTTLIILPTVWLRNLSLLSYLSAGGVAASLVVVLCLLWVGVVDQVGFHPSGSVLELTNMPIAIGLYSACYSGHTVFPNIYTSMEKPSEFPKILIICFTTCGLLYIAVAASGYMMFGDSIQSQFTLNMPHKFICSKIAVWTTVINPLSKYALTIYPVVLSVEELLPSPQLKSYCVSIIIRTLLVLSTLVVSLTVPFFGLVMALIGSFSTMLVALIFPCACYLSIYRHRLNHSEIGMSIVIIVIGVVCCCVGSYSAILRIVEEMVG